MPALPAFPRPRGRSSEPATLRAEARLSREGETLSSSGRLERLSTAVDTNEIDQDGVVRILCYLAWYDQERADDERANHG